MQCLFLTPPFTSSFFCFFFLTAAATPRVSSLEMWQWWGRRCGRHEGLCWVWSRDPLDWQEGGFSFLNLHFLSRMPAPLTHSPAAALVYEIINVYFMDGRFGELDTTTATAVFKADATKELNRNQADVLESLPAVSCMCNECICKSVHAFLPHFEAMFTSTSWGFPGQTPPWHRTQERRQGSKGGSLPDSTREWLLPNAMQGDICKP